MAEVKITCPNCLMINNVLKKLAMKTSDLIFVLIVALQVIHHIQTNQKH